MNDQERPGINPTFWLKYPKSAIQMVFLVSQGNKIIQKHQTVEPIEKFCTILSKIFKSVVDRQTQLRWKPVKKYIGEIGLERPSNLFYNLTEWSIGVIKKVWPRFALKNFRKFWTNMEFFPPASHFFASVFAYIYYSQWVTLLCNYQLPIGFLSIKDDFLALFSSSWKV